MDFIFIAKQYGDESVVSAVRFIKIEADDSSFPTRPRTLRCIFLTFRPPLVGLGADHEDEVGFLDLVHHPNGPSLGSPFQFLVDHHRKAVAAQSMR